MSIYSQQELDKILCSIPKEWRDGIVEAIDAIDNCPAPDVCTSVKSCETKTSLQPFEYKDNKLSITFIDENKVKHKSILDVSTLFDNLLVDISFDCLPENWVELSFKDKIQFIINNHCSCCPTTTTTTSTTTTSTTTTTTAAPCIVVTDIQMSAEII